MDQQDEVLQDLTLALAYLTSWQERPGEMHRFWKSYDWDVLDALENKDLIPNSRRAKSAYLTEDGVKRARRALERFGIPE